MDDGQKTKSSWWERWVGSGKKEELESVLEDQQGRISQLEEELSLATFKIVRLESFEEQCATLTKQLEESSEELEGAKRKWVESEKQRLQLQGQIHQQKQGLEELQSSLTQVQEEDRRKGDELLSLQSTSEEWQQKAQTLQTQIKQFESQLQDATTWKQELEQKTAACTSYEARIKELEQLLHNTTESLSSETEKKRALEARERKLKASIETMEKQLSSAESSKSEEHQKYLEELQAHHREQVDGLQQQIQVEVERGKKYEENAERLAEFWRRCWNSLSDSVVFLTGNSTLHLWKQSRSNETSDIVLPWESPAEPLEKLHEYLHWLEESEWVSRHECLKDVGNGTLRLLLTAPSRRALKDRSLPRALPRLPWLHTLLNLIEEMGTRGYGIDVEELGESEVWLVLSRLS